MSSEEWGTGVTFLGPFPLPDARRHFLPSPPGVGQPGPSPQEPLPDPPSLCPFKMFFSADSALPQRLPEKVTHVWRSQVETFTPFR